MIRHIPPFRNNLPSQMLVLPFKSGQNKGNVKFEPDVSKSTEYRKKYIYIKKEKIMVDTYESKKAKALWQTLRLSSASYDGLILLLLILCDY